MKHCPKCYRVYGDDTLRFCLDDGEILTAAELGDHVRSTPASTHDDFQPQVLPTATRADAQTEVMHGHDFKRQLSKPRSFPAYVYVIVSLVVVIAFLVVAIAALIAWSATKGTGEDPPISSNRGSNSKPGSVPTPKPNPSPTVPDLTSQLIGKWEWGTNSMSFSPDGTGTDENSGKKCFDYDYAVTGDVLRITEVGTKTCGVSGEYRIKINGDDMVCVFIGTGYVTNWKRVR